MTVPQESAAPTVQALASELIDVATSLDAFKKPGFSIYNMEDLARQTDFGAQYPMVAVAYEGIIETDDTPSQTGSSRGRPGASSVKLLFTVVIGVEYHAAGNDDTKPCATDLLDSLRRQLLGFVGVNARPWEIHAEQPLGGDMSEGVLWYGQQWATQVVYLGRPQT